LWLVPVQVQPGENRLGSGNFFGAVRGRITRSSAFFTDLRHSIPRQLPWHSHELSFFGLLLDGEYGERYGRENKQFGPFSIMFRPAGVPHQDEIGPRGVRFFHVELRPGWKEQLAECSGSLERPCEDSRGGKLIWLAMKLRRATFEVANPDELCMDSLLAELVALAAQLPIEEKHQFPSWLTRLLDRLQAEHCERLTLDNLSREARVHPVHLSRVFRRFKGEGIGEYVHRLRARSACRLLLNPEMNLADIGFATGFSDQSHFTRAFRKITGMTPNTFRSSISSGLIN
jgi:AraC family transcriptional regulator